MKVGSLCSGYEGIGLGLELVFGDVEHSWFVEYDAAPSKILTHHWPTVPNYGDVKHTDWSAVEPVDLLTAGYPCQPFSHAGLRKGADDPRHLWPGVERAISVLRPRLVLLENVRGHVSLGLDAVLGDLAALGYDASWGVVRASDAGAPHSRARIFILAADTDGGERSGRCGPGAVGGGAPGAGEEGLQRQRSGDSADGRGATAPDACGERHGRGEDARSLGRVDGTPEGVSWERERPRSEPVDRGAEAAADAGRGSLAGAAAAGDGLRLVAECGHVDAPDTHEQGPQGGESAGRLDLSSRGASADPTCDRRDEGRSESARLVGGPDASERGDTAWGDYAPAIARWEQVTGRHAPRPTEPGRTGERLSPRFVEWMMGLPAGHVSDVPGLARNAQLKALGNGVVPQQAALALRTLLPLAVAA